MTTKTTYGSCPKCGESCQPDWDYIPGKNPDDIIEETAICCDCKIAFSYRYTRAFNDVHETYHEVWEAVNIEDISGWGFTPRECD